MRARVLIAALIGMGLTVALVALSFERMGNEARAMLLGSLCGLVASSPITLIILYNVWVQWEMRRVHRFTQDRGRAIGSSEIVTRCQHDVILNERRCFKCERDGLLYIPARTGGNHAD